MPRIEPELQRLQEIKTLPSLLKYLKEDLNWPIGSDDVEEVTFDYDPAELGFDSASTAKIDEVRQLRPLTAGQKWGIFWVKFGKKQLPVQMLRRALGNLVVKKRASTKKSDKAAWHMHDLLFISAYGDDSNRHITFAHFSESEDSEKSLPVLKVLGWDDDDTLLHLKDTYKTLVSSLNWENTPVDDPEAWREHWSTAFKVGHREVINTTKELVVKLAQLATVIKKSVLTSIKAETDKGPWKKLMLAFQKTLIKDLDEDQFADVIAQTVSYGLLTARLSSDGRISLKNLVDMVPSTNPFLKELLQHFLNSAGMKGLFDVDEAGINDVVELLNRANAQAIRNDFGKKTDGQDPVIHFYEHFLGAYDKELKVERGVFYTPQAIVSYIVRSAHQLLQTEFGLEDGLADTSTWAEVQSKHASLKFPEGIKDPKIEPFVQILDPATGTATFLIEVIDVIHNTMVTRWDKERVSKTDQVKKWNTYVPTHLLPRLYAYELMMAPYAIAHMKVGLKLSETGFTAWEKLGSENRANIYLTNALEPWTQQPELPGFNALAHESAAVNEVKKSKRFTVVIGNPPYSAISSNLTQELRKIVEPYRYVNGEKIKERSMLQFERNIQDDYVKFLALSQLRLHEAGVGLSIFITNHSYLDGPTLRGVRWNLLSQFPKTWFLDLHGNSNKGERPPAGKSNESVFDIKQGVGIAALLRPPTDSNKATRISDLWGTQEEKYGFLAEHTLTSTPFQEVVPKKPFYYLIAPETGECSTEWENWPSIAEVFTKRSTGTESGFDDLMIAFTEKELKSRVQKFCDQSVPLADLEKEFDFSDGHAAALFSRRTEFKSATKDEFKPLQLRAYDYRRAFLRKNLLKTNSFNVMLDLSLNNPGLVTTRQTKENFVAFAVSSFCGHKVTSSYDRSYVFPLFTVDDDSLIPTKVPCISQAILSYFKKLTSDNDDLRVARKVFDYALAVMNAPTYRKLFDSQLKRDFPRFPLTQNLELFHKLSLAGGALASLNILDFSSPGKPSLELTGDSSTEVDKISWSNNTVWIDKAQTVGFKGLNEDLWNFHVGGHQVCERWLKDRKGRKLTKDDIEHYQKIVVALSETIRLMAEIDKVIDEHGGWPGAFQASK
jgi:predicted helicase